MNNIAISVLSVQPNAAQTATAASSVSGSSSNTKDKASFSNTLDKAVSKSDETGVKQERVSGIEPKEPVAAKNDSKKNDTLAAQEQTPPEDSDVKTDNLSAEGNPDSLQVQASLINAILVTQTPLSVPTVAVPNPNNQQTGSEQLPTAVSAAATALPKLSIPILAEGKIIPVNVSGNNNLKDQQQNTLPVANQVQTGQAVPEMLNQLSGMVTEVVTGTNSSASVQSALPQAQVTGALQDQTGKGEANLNPAPAIMSQAAEIIQAPTANQVPIATSQNLSVAALPQQPVKEKLTIQPETAKAVSAVTDNQVLSPEEQMAIPVVESTHQQDSLSANLNNQEQNTNLKDTGTLKVGQEIPNKLEKAINSAEFSQNLNGAIVAASSTASQVQPTATPAQATPDVYQVVEQIVEQAKVIARQQNTEMVMQLKPEHLGELTLKVAVENGVVNASFHSNNPEVRGLLEASLPQLKQELSNAGLKVDNVSVYAGLSQFQPNQGQERNQQQQLMKSTNKKAVKDFVEAVEGDLTGSSLTGVGLQAGVDYRI